MASPQDEQAVGISTVGIRPVAAVHSRLVLLVLLMLSNGVSGWRMDRQRNECKTKFVKAMDDSNGRWVPENKNLSGNERGLRPACVVMVSETCRVMHGVLDDCETSGEVDGAHCVISPRVCSRLNVTAGAEVAETVRPGQCAYMYAGVYATRLASTGSGGRDVDACTLVGPGTRSRWYKNRLTAWDSKWTCGSRRCRRQCRCDGPWT
jgi:hypothetical protein